MFGLFLGFLIIIETLAEFEISASLAGREGKPEFGLLPWEISY